MNQKLKSTTFIILSFILSGALFFFAYLYSKSIVNESYEEQINSNLYELNKILDSFKNEKIPMLKTLVEHKAVKEFLQNGDSKSVEKLFIDFTKANSHIFQMRILSLDGKERIRVDKNHNKIYIIENKDLQNKFHRYYFQKFLELKKSEIGFSYLDLNIENKTIEKPFKSTLRVGMPIFRGDKKEAILVINYYMNDFLHQLLRSSNFDKYLIDKEGYFIIHKEPNLNWSRYLDKKIKADELFNIVILDDKLINKDNSLSLKKFSLLGNEYYLLFKTKKDLSIVKFIDQSKQIGVIIFFAALFLILPFLSLLYKYLKKLKDVNRSIRDSKNKMESILNNTSDAIIVIDKKAVIKELNQAAIKIFGYEKEELLDNNVNILIPHPHHLKHDDYVKNHDKDIQTKIVNKDRELYGLHKNGKFIPISLTVTKVEIKDELYFIGNIKDMTQESKSKRLFEVVFDTSPVGIALVLKDGSFWRVSKKFCVIVGYEREELVNLNFRDITHKDDLQQDLDLVQKVLNKEIEQYSIEKRYIKKDGKIVWVKLTVTAVYVDDKKELIDYYIATIDNITEDKKIKNELLETQEQLVEAEKIAQIGHWNFNLESGQLKWSKNFLKIFKSKKRVFTYDDYLNSIVETQREEVKNAIDEAIKEQKTFDMIYKISVDEEIRTIHSKGTIRFENKKAKSFLGTCQDITDIKRLEEEKNQKEHMLMQQSKLAAMGEMTSAIAHQWRQPLNSIGFIIQDLISAYKHNEFDENYLYEAKKEVMEQLKYMSDTIDEFRKFFKKDEPKTEFNLLNTIEDINRLYIAQLTSHRISLIFKVEGKVVKNIDEVENRSSYNIRNQEGQLKQVILNCVSNAKDAILNLDKPSKIQTRIVVQLQKLNDGVEISISDYAGGISKEDVPRIFEPYFTTKSMGTGLGLYICKSICEKSLEAEIEYKQNLYEEEGKIYEGATFVIKLIK